MSIKYSIESNILMTISLMKAHHIRDVVISPGGTNVCLTTSLHNDDYFTLYSCVDERSAAYMACGIAAETCRAVALCCTGATASRNYVPALTEAYYRKLPILVLTTSQHEGKVGNNFPQVTDRSKQMNDILCYSTHIPVRMDNNMDRWHCNVEINKAMLTLTRNGGGPAHINLATDSSIDFSISTLPDERVIHRIEAGQPFPAIANQRIAIYVGNHKKWSTELTASVETFCARYNAAVLCDHTSNYHGKYKVEACVVSTQTQYHSPLLDIDLLIHIGDVSGAYMNLSPRKVWRVNPDGEVRDTFYTLDYVFQMSEEMFFAHWAEQATTDIARGDYAQALQDECAHMRQQITDLPLSNAWLAQQTAKRIPEGAQVHFGILNSLRTWNYFHLDNSIDCFCNTGGFGIDGCLSSAIGASLVHPEKIYYCILGDLAFFYDMNSMGIRHIGPNIRVIMVNNGCGAEFHIPACVTKRAGLEKDFINEFTAASGHYGKKSDQLIRHLSEDLGFEYLAIYSKEDYLKHIDRITSAKALSKPLFVEVFTEVDDDAEALKKLTTLQRSTKGAAKELAKSILGAKNLQRLKNTLGS